MIFILIEKVKIKDMNGAEYNPRKDLKENDKEYQAIKNSLDTFGYLSPIVWNRQTGRIIGGHQRYKILVAQGATEIECVVVDFDEEKEKACNIALNSAVGEWDNDKLDALLFELQYSDFLMSDFGIDMSDFEEIETEEKYYKSNETSGSINDTFGVPPFSILDTRQGYWQDRKREWLSITGDLTETKENVLYQKDSLMDQINGGSSNFDPVLAELMMKWFNVENGRILDPFGGEQTKGVVSGELGYSYSAVEIRQEQVETNREKTKQYDKVKYYLGDSNNISEIIKERNFDLVFTSPPYYDLEVYSKDDMSALGTYDEFMQQYRNIFQQCYEMLAENRFLVIKIGEIRNKKTGEYRNFVGDNIQLFKDIGFKYYNEIILVNPCGTVPLRAKKLMETRKIGKVHQNILVFYKGDLKKIKDNFQELSEGFADIPEQEN